MITMAVILFVPAHLASMSRRVKDFQSVSWHLAFHRIHELLFYAFQADILSSLPRWLLVVDIKAVVRSTTNTTLPSANLDIPN